MKKKYVLYYIHLLKKSSNGVVNSIYVKIALTYSSGNIIIYEQCYTMSCTFHRNDLRLYSDFV